MHLRSLPLALIGRREAILDAASSRMTLPFGALLVLSAGLAREYDGEDLLHEPWLLLRPFAASITTAALLYFTLLILAGLRKRQGAFTIRRFPSFLGLYWLSAPCAWLYAVPFERFLDPLDAVRCNLLLLLTVSVWRVAYITRVVCVLHATRPVPTSLVTACFGLFVLWVGAIVMPKPILDIMGGLRMDAHDRFISDVTTTFIVLAVPVILVLFVAAIIGQRWWEPEPPPETVSASRPGPLMAFGAAAVLMWAPALVLCQPEQRNRRVAERLFAEEKYREMLEYASGREPGDFPPHWDFPPREFLSYEPWIEGIVGETPKQTAPWVLQRYTDKFSAELIYRTRYQDDVPPPFWWTRLFESGPEMLLLSPEAARPMVLFLLTHDRSVPEEVREKLLQEWTAIRTTAPRPAP